MNQMNSIVIEGRATEYATNRPTGNFCVTKMTVENTRLYKRNDGKLKEELTSFTVEAYGEHWANAVRKAFDKNSDGTKCRIVGRIAMKNFNRQKGLMIVAEHLEFPVTA